MADRGTSVSSFESETFGDSTLRGSSELINGQERGTRTRRSSARHRSRLSSFFAPPQIRSDPKEAKFLLETLSSKQVTWQTLNICSAIVLSVTYTLAMSLFARRFEAALPALNLVDRVVVYCFCVLQLTFTIVYFLRLYRYGWIRCTFEMRSCFLQGLFIFFTMNMIGNIARTISEKRAAPRSPFSMSPTWSGNGSGYLVFMDTPWLFYDSIVILRIATRF